MRGLVDFKPDDKTVIDALKAESKREVDEILKEPLRLINEALDTVRLRNSDGSYREVNGRIEEDWTRLTLTDLQELMFKLAAYNITLTNHQIEAIMEQKFSKLIAEDDFAQEILKAEGSNAEERKSNAKLKVESRYLALYKELYRVRFDKTTEAIDRMYASCSRIATLRAAELDRFRE